MKFQFTHSVISDSLPPHGRQHTRLPCPSPSPTVCSNSCPLSQWCHPTISSSVIPFSFPLSVPASGSFPMSWLFATGGQILELQLQHEYAGLISFRMDWLDLLAVQRTLKRVFSNTAVKSINSSALSFLYSPTLTSISSAQFSRSVVSDSLWPVNCSMPGLPVHHQLLEST